MKKTISKLIFMGLLSIFFKSNSQEINSIYNLSFTSIEGEKVSLETFKGKTSLKFRELMSSKAFGLTAYYDSMISNWFNEKLKIEFPERKTVFGRKFQKLRYGENPHQQSSIYVSDYEDQRLGFNQIHGKELSYNNYNYMFASLQILDSLKKKFWNCNH